MHKIEKVLIDRIKNNELHIDSLYIEEKNNLNKIIDNDKLHEIRSCAKLLTSIAIGIAIDRNMLTLQTKIYPVIKNVANITNIDNIEKIKKWTIRNLLTHTTGYEGQMMSESFIKDIDKNELIDYALNYNITYDSGTRFAYNNVEPFILSVFFQEKFNINLTDFIDKNIFLKLDIKEFKWNSYGKYCPGATGLYLKPKDFHKIGKLILNNGKYNNIQVVSEKWINEMCKLQLETPSAYKKERVFPKVGIGYFTFVSRDGYVFRDGSNGQYIIINKDKNLLITIMSTEKEISKITEIFRGIY